MKPFYFRLEGIHYVISFVYVNGEECYLFHPSGRFGQDFLIYPMSYALKKSEFAAMLETYSRHDSPELLRLAYKYLNEHGGYN